MRIEGGRSNNGLSPADSKEPNRYCRVCRFDGDMIVEVRAYLDSMMVDYTILRGELARK